LAKLANMEMTVLQAKNNLSKLLRHAEEGGEVVIRRGPGGKAFRLTPVETKRGRTLAPNPRWAGKISYKDEDIWATEWRDEP
jgi:antitoxin (DNA-binding transcriptional repressor) of toxin-antitoxin stability system